MSALAAVGRSIARVVPVAVGVAVDELSVIARLPAKQFRTMLRVLTRGMHVEQADKLLRARAASGLELLADDVNTLLNAVLLCDPPRLILSYLSIVKKGEGGLPESGERAASIIAGAMDVFEKWDTGELSDLNGVRYQRSPEIHLDKAKEKVAAGGQKRPRSEVTQEASAAAMTVSENDSGAGAGARSNDVVALVADVAKVGVGAVAGSDILLANGQRPGPVASAMEIEMRANSERFKELSDAILEKMPSSLPGASTVWKLRRFSRASVIFNALAAGDFVASGPNARSFALMLHGALTACDIEEGCRLLARMTSPTSAGHPAACEVSELYTVLQPSMLQDLATAGIISKAVAVTSLVSEKNTPKWFFLKAAFEATKGDQFGSKHGVVITKSGVYLSHGHNHRFGVPNDKHLRVMHSEMHALVKLPAAADAIGAEVWIVELDGAGIGYEEAIACVMCNKGLFKLGLAKQHYSSHSGVRSQSMTSGHKPTMVCESYEMALRRTYPLGTKNPDIDDELDFDFSKPNAGDPGRGNRNPAGAGAGE